MTDEQLYSEILRALEIDHQYVAHFDLAQTEPIARTRSLGRKAGRHFGWKVRTFQTDPSARADGLVVVVVAVIESTPAEQTRIEERSEFLIRNMKL